MSQEVASEVLDKTRELYQSYGENLSAVEAVGCLMLTVLFVYDAIKPGVQRDAKAKG